MCTVQSVQFPQILCYIKSWKQFTYFPLNLHLFSCTSTRFDTFEMIANEVVCVPMLSTTTPVQDRHTIVNNKWWCKRIIDYLIVTVMRLQTARPTYMLFSFCIHWKPFFFSSHWFYAVLSDYNIYFITFIIKWIVSKRIFHEFDLLYDMCLFAWW